MNDHMVSQSQYLSDFTGNSSIISIADKSGFAQKKAERRLLFISYAFPPTGGGGVQRAAKFAKYLPSHGWNPTVLTVENPSVPVQDNDLSSELDPRTNIIRARTWEPRYGLKKQLTASSQSGSNTIRRALRRICMRFLQPDPQILWNRSAFRLAAKTLRNQAHDVILVTGPPFSSFLLGCNLKKHFGLPLVLDFRDEWLIACQYLENHEHDGASFRRQHAMMQRALKAADAIIATSMASAGELARHCSQANSSATVDCIYNGYDPDDMLRPARDNFDSPKLRIVYTGTLWKLTDISPLVSALLRLQRLAPQLSSRIELIIAGRQTQPQREVLERLAGSAISVVLHEYLPHSQSLQLAYTADLLVLLLADEPGTERVVPAKIFEYLALQKPILAISALGETSDLLKQYSRSFLFKPDQIESISNWLHDQLQDWPDCSSLQADAAIPCSTQITQFSRPYLTGQLANILEATHSKYERTTRSAQKPLTHSIV